MDAEVLKLIAVLNILGVHWEQFKAHGAEIDVDVLMEYIANSQGK